MKTSPRYLFAIVLLWGVVAAVVLSSGLALQTPPGVIPATVLLLAAAFIVALGRAAPLRNAITAIPTQWLVGFNSLRFVGGTFLWYLAHGRLPALFANCAGWGDVATAAGALALLATGAWKSRVALAAWNVFGTLDLFVAVGTAAVLTFDPAGTMAEMTHLPLGLIPLWAVPMMLTVHAELFRRLRRSALRTTSPTESWARA